MSSLNVLTENKGSVSGADLQSYLPSEQADYFQSKFKANGDDSFAYTGFAVVPGGISSAAAASNATYAGPSSVASTPTASPYTTPSKSAAASSTPATPNFNASPVRTPLNIASPAAVRASTASPAVSSPSVYKAPAALSVDTTPTKTSSFPEFDNNLRMRKAYDDGITMLTTENDDKILRFELENAGTKAYEFTMVNIQKKKREEKWKKGLTQSLAELYRVDQPRAHLSQAGQPQGDHGHPARRNQDTRNHQPAGQPEGGLVHAQGDPVRSRLIRKNLCP